MSKRDISKRFKITACADGFVSIIDVDDKSKQRRLGAALPAHSVDSQELAMILIEQCTYLRRCLHGGKLGSTIEPRARNWPLRGSVADTTYLEDFGELLAEAESKLK